MASLYRKPNSNTIWLRYKQRGKWKGKPTSYHWDNPGDVRQAHRLAQKASDLEHQEISDSTELLHEWVQPWLDSTYGTALNTTPQVYRRMWRKIEMFLAEQKIHTASQISRDFIMRYLAWRLKSAGRNQAIAEIKFTGMILREAVLRGHITANPLSKPGLRKAPPKEKLIWTNADMEKAAAHFAKTGCHWMQAAFYMGLYQACRLRQSAVPLAGISLERMTISYPGSIVKGAGAYTQPIDPKFVPLLRRLIAQAHSLRLDCLCVVPWDASMRLRDALDRAGLPGLSHHGLRATWITRAAEIGVPESQAMAFCHHSSREVHRVYKKLSTMGISHVPALLNLPTLKR